MASDCKERIKGKGLKKGRKKEQKIFLKSEWLRKKEERVKRRTNENSVNEENDKKDIRQFTQHEYKYK